MRSVRTEQCVWCRLKMHVYSTEQCGHACVCVCVCVNLTACVWTVQCVPHACVTGTSFMFPSLDFDHVPRFAVFVANHI